MAHSIEKVAPKASVALVPLASTGWRGRASGASGYVYSPGGCGCALLMAPVMAAAVGLAALSLGMAVLAVAGLAAAIVLTVREVRRTRGGADVRTGFAIAAGALYLVSVPYLIFFIWLWFVD